MTLDILVIDDQFGRDASMQRMLESTLIDFPATLAFCTAQRDDDSGRHNDVSEAVRAVGERSPGWALVLLDMQFDSGPITDDGLPAGDVGDERFGLRIEAELLQRFPGLPIVRFTSAHERSLGEGGMPQARPFLSKLAATATDLRLALLEYGVLSLSQRRLLLQIPVDTVVASESLFRLYVEAFRLAQTDGYVLILGESGTGKEHLARYLHAVSSRCAAPFVALNLGGVPPTLIETELFGAVRGAYTGAATRSGRFAQAADGTLFLDELAAMPADKQPALLRVLEERQFTPVGAGRSSKVRCNVIAASQDLLDEMSVTDRLRSDLLARFHHTLHIPPLRQRPEDVAATAADCLQRALQAQRKSGIVFEEGVLERLCSHPLPRNVRDIEASVRRAVAMRPNNSVVRWEHLGLDGSALLPTPAAPPAEATAARAAAALWRDEFAVATPARVVGAGDPAPPEVASVPLRGALKVIDHMALEMRNQAVLRALRHCQHPISGKVRVLPAMQLLTDNPQLSSMAAKRLLNQLLGHASGRPLDPDELERLIDTAATAESGR